MDYLERLGQNAVVPVVVLQDAQQAIPTAQAMLAGGIDVMEVTLRTDAALDAIQSVSQAVPDMLVGAGTVTTLQQCKEAVAAGAKFIVTPGFDAEITKWCVDQGLNIMPGCVTPTEIMQAKALGLRVLKFFPANLYGGLSGMKALSGPFKEIRFLPTGGVNGQNIGEYAAAPFVYTVGGSWVCPQKDIEQGNFEKITQLCKDAVTASLGLQVVHVGFNMPNAGEAMQLAQSMEQAFGFAVKDGNSSIFVGSGMEIMKEPYLGQNGHIALQTNNVARAVAYLQKKGFAVDEKTAKYRNQQLIAVYLKQDFGGFAIHLLQK